MPIVRCGKKNPGILDKNILNIEILPRVSRMTLRAPSCPGLLEVMQCITPPSVAWFETTASHCLGKRKKLEAQPEGNRNNNQRSLTEQFCILGLSPLVQVITSDPRIETRTRTATHCIRLVGISTRESLKLEEQYFTELAREAKKLHVSL